jgi:hypothetical protein
MEHLSYAIHHRHTHLPPSSEITSPPVTAASAAARHMEVMTKKTEMVEEAIQMESKGAYHR